MSTDIKSISRNQGAEDFLDFTPDDLAKLFHYPSIGQLFSSSDSNAINEFQSGLISTRDQLEKVVRLGGKEDADRANVVIRGVDVTLDFLSTLQQMRTSKE